MASAEMQLVCKIIKTGELKRVLEWGITEEDFMSLEPRNIFKQIIAIFTNPDTSGSVIGPNMAATMFTQLNMGDVDTSVTLEHLCTDVRRRRIAKEIKEKAQKAIEEADVNPLGSLDILNEACASVRRLDAGKFTDVDFATGMDNFWKRYIQVKAGMRLGVIPWPWLSLEDETGGVQEDEYAVLFGRPKSMKSWVLCYIIAWVVAEAWLDHNTLQNPMTKHQRVLVYTKEMTPDNIYTRLAACLAGVPYSETRHARLTPQQEAQIEYWVNLAKSLAKENRLIVLSAKDVAGRDTVSWLRSKVDKYAPTIVFIDGLYLMSPENSKIVKLNERVQSISRDLRQLILDTKTPVIATMQANRKAAGHEDANLDEIAFSDAIAQDATMLIRVINDKNEPNQPSTISLVFGGAREINFPGMRIFGTPAVNFGYCSTLTEKEIEKAKTADDPDDPKDAKSGKVKREPRTLGGASAQATSRAGAATGAKFTQLYKNAIKKI